MLVPFAIDADSLAPDQAWSSAQQLECHQSLIGIWRRIGMLVHDGNNFDGSHLKQSVANLPQKLRPLWMEMLERGPLRCCGNTWDGAITNGSIGELIDLVRVALVDDARAEVEFGLPEDRLSKLADNAQSVEVCRLMASANARTFLSALDIAASHIEAKTTFREIWDTRFHALAGAPIKLVSVVDRFMFSKHFECPQTYLSGIVRFLVELDRSASGAKQVTLYSAWTDELQEKTSRNWDDAIIRIQKELSDVLNKKLLKKEVKRLKIVMVPNGAFGNLHHDRFARFGGYVWDIGRGLEVLQGPWAADRSTASFKTGIPVVGYKLVEQELSSHKDARKVEVCS